MYYNRVVESATNRSKTMNTANTTAAQDLQEMMNGWNTIMAAAKIEFPAATEEELFQIVSSAMRHAMGMK